MSTKKKGSLKKRSLKGKIKLLIQLLVLGVLLVMAVAVIYFYQTYGRTLIQMQSEAKKLVRASSRDTFRAAETSLVYDSEGDIISSLRSEKDVYYIEYQNIPQAVIDAMVVTEDKKFLSHDGIDYLANIRAAMALIKNKGEIRQGASTITQQLARNVFLTHTVTYERKIVEIFLAQELEKKYNKKDILEFYLNNIYFANGHYGIQAASYGYFGKGAAQLSLSQIAFLCAIPNSPNRYNPIGNFKNTMERRDRILVQLLNDEKVTLPEYRKALNETIVLNLQKPEKKNYVETFVYHSTIRALMARKGFEFKNQFINEEEKQAYEEAYYELYYSCQRDMYVAGYRIYTSIDLKKQQLLQQAVDEALQDFIETNEEGVYRFQGAAVTIDNDNGRVVAIVGGRSQDLSGYTLNRGYQTFRQPGSAIKPLIVYAPAFERGYTPDSLVLDEKFEGGPKNSGGKYSGEMKLQRAIEVSKNTVAWKLFEELTPKTALSYLLQMNFSRIHKNDYFPAASLGGFTIGVSPLEMAAAYAALENDGFYREPTCIIKIMDASGNEIIGEKSKEKPVYQKEAARMITEALTGVIKNGTGKGLALKETVSAGKTGTTDEKKDGWFVGYTPYYTTSVWVGYDIPQPVEDLAGATYPGRIWHKFMDQIHTPDKKASFRFFNWRDLLNRQQEAFPEESMEEELNEEEDNPEDENISEREDIGEQPVNTVDLETEGEETDKQIEEEEIREEDFDGTPPEEEPEDIEELSTGEDILSEEED